MATLTKSLRSKNNFRFFSRLAAGVLALFFSDRGYSAVFIDFANAADYNTGFTEVVSGTDSLTYSSVAGVGGAAGRVNVTQGANTDTTALYNGSSFDLSSSGPFTISAFFLVPTPIGGSAYITAAQVGFSESLSQGFYSGAGQDYVSARVRSANTGFQYTLEGTHANNGTVTNADVSSSFSLSPGNWYKISATFTDVGTSFTYTAMVEDYGTTGSTFVSLIQSISNGMAQTSLANGSDTSAYGAFRANGNLQNKVMAIDNFVVIPEPSSWALLGSGIIILALLGCRSQNLSRHQIGNGQ